MPFYDNFVAQCAKINKKPSVVAQELGLAKSAVSHWKARGAAPRDAMQHKIAAYFGCPVEELTGASEELKNPAHNEVNEISVEQIKAAFRGKSFEELTDILSSLTQELKNIK